MTASACAVCMNACVSVRTSQHSMVEIDAVITMLKLLHKSQSSDYRVCGSMGVAHYSN